MVQTIYKIYFKKLKAFFTFVSNEQKIVSKTCSTYKRIFHEYHRSSSSSSYSCEARIDLFLPPQPRKRTYSRSRFDSGHIPAPPTLYTERVQNTKQRIPAISRAKSRGKPHRPNLLSIHTRRRRRQREKPKREYRRRRRHPGSERESIEGTSIPSGAAFLAKKTLGPGKQIRRESMYHVYTETKERGTRRKPSENLERTVGKQHDLQYRELRGDEKSFSPEQKRILSSKYSPGKRQRPLEFNLSASTQILTRPPPPLHLYIRRLGKSSREISAPKRERKSAALQVLYPTRVIATATGYIEERRRARGLNGE